MHGGALEIAEWSVDFSFAKAGDRQMTPAAKPKMKRLSQQCRRPFTFSALGGTGASAARGMIFEGE
jgi:hypothetical protein